MVTGIVVAMGFAMLALAFTRTAKPSGISIEELDYLYGVNTTQLQRFFGYSCESAIHYFCKSHVCPKVGHRSKKLTNGHWASVVINFHSLLILVRSKTAAAEIAAPTPRVRPLVVLLVTLIAQFLLQIHSLDRQDQRSLP